MTSDPISPERESGTSPEPPAESIRLDPLDPDTPLGSGIDFSDPNSPLAPLYVRTIHVVAVAIFGLFALFVSNRLLFHTDVWAHLAYGRWMLEHGSFPEQEPLNPFTDKSSPPFNSMWLTQTTAYWLYQLGGKLAGGDAVRQMEGGVEFLCAAFTVVVLITLAGLCTAYTRISGSLALGLLGACFVLVTMQPLTAHRPQIVGLACFAWVLAGLSRPVPTRRALIWVPAVMTLWANGHGSFVVGLMMMTLFLIGRVIENWEPDRWRSIVTDVVVRRTALILLLSMLTVTINPYGWRIYTNVLAFAGNPNLKTFTEWLPLDFSEAAGGHVAYYMSLGVVVLLQVISPKPLPPTQLLMLMAFAVWPLLQTRSMSWWMMLAPWFFTPLWSALAQARGITLPESTAHLGKTVLAIFMAICFILPTPLVQWLRDKKPRSLDQSVTRGTPHEISAILFGGTGSPSDRTEVLAKAVRKRFEGKPVGTVFTSETLGDYLVWATPGKPVMLFTHGEKFQESYWSSCMTVKNGGLGWWEFLDRYRANVIVVEPDLHAVLVQKLRSSPQWDVVLDESKIDYPEPQFNRHFVAIRKAPFFDGGAR